MLVALPIALSIHRASPAFAQSSENKSAIQITCELTGDCTTESVVAGWANNVNPKFIKLYDGNGRYLKYADLSYLQFPVVIKSIPEKGIVEIVKNLWVNINDLKIQSATATRESGSARGFSVRRSNPRPDYVGTPYIAVESYLPWPPLKPSCWSDITNNFAVRGTFGDIDKQIKNLLVRRGYDDLSYFHAGKGFSVVTHLERLDEVGFPKQPRWTSTKVPAGGSILEYMHKLVYGETDTFRVITFVVTDEDFRFQLSDATKVDVIRWTTNGTPILTKDLMGKRVSPDTRIWLFIYEFNKTRDKSEDLLFLSANRSIAFYRNWFGLHK